MGKLFKYLKEHKAAVVAIVALLIVQAYCDLSLPSYTSDIVDVGIQQNGIERGVPEVIRGKTLEFLTLFMEEEQAKQVKSAYEAGEDNKYELIVKEDEKLAEAFRTHFKPQPGYKASYKISIDGKKEPLCVKVQQTELTCEWKDEADCDVLISTDMDTILEITRGKMTFQRAFMSAGSMKVKGDFKLLRMLDQLFVFMEE